MRSRHIKDNDPLPYRHLQHGGGDPGVLGDVGVELAVRAVVVGRQEDELRLVVVRVGDAHVHLWGGGDDR